MESKNKDFPHNYFITFAMPALPVLEASALLKFQQFCRVLRDQVKDRGRRLSYLWVAGVVAKAINRLTELGLIVKKGVQLSAQ